MSCWLLENQVKVRQCTCRYVYKARKHSMELLSAAAFVITSMIMLLSCLDIYSAISIYSTVYSSTCCVVS